MQPQLSDLSPLCPNPPLLCSLPWLSSALGEQAQTSRLDPKGLSQCAPLGSWLLQLPPSHPGGFPVLETPGLPPMGPALGSWLTRRCLSLCPVRPSCTVAGFTSVPPLCSCAFCDPHPFGLCGNGRTQAWLLAWDSRPLAAGGEGWGRSLPAGAQGSGCGPGLAEDQLCDPGS